MDMTGDDLSVDLDKNFFVENYFTSEVSMLIFALLYLDGSLREMILGITKDMYSSLKMSKKWRNEILNKLHPDKCSHLECGKAVSALNDIYSRMKKNGK